MKYYKKKEKDYSQNKIDLKAYYNVGKLLVESKNNMNSKYKNYCIKMYINRLKRELNINLSNKNLEFAKKFYLYIKRGMIFSSKLTWGHYRELISLKDINKINEYIKSFDENITIRQIRKQIKEELISNKLLKQLGPHYTYIDDEHHITKNNIIDLILYHKKYRAYVVIELKTTDLKAIYIGQIWNHMNYVNKKIKNKYDNDTIGIILKKINDEYIIEYCSDSRIYNATYTFF